MQDKMRAQLEPALYCMHMTQSEEAEQIQTTKKDCNYLRLQTDRST